jgi:hypothetical protein
MLFAKNLGVLKDEEERTVWLQKSRRENEGI